MTHVAMVLHQTTSASNFLGNSLTQTHTPCVPLASFPGGSHLQYLIAYSMQIRRGKAWETLSRAVTSGRQMVDTRGAVPDSSNSRFVSNRPWRYKRRMVLTLPC